ncbi:AI-2E family transporter [Tardiphaga alba]|uniref:AI-2E family transporter n=1 Tax=Tardiphaga alba TaxID=340268 RepID=A0ABX8AD03_9BRAD|nr:AI-2E family transporter [Tardiphaga alba]QUS41577.1 AI-2E family transporter [Tardiphaga alba]
MSARLEDRTFMLLLIAVSLAFGWILSSFYSAILWGVVMAIMFAPMHRRLLARMPKHSNSAALLTVGLIVLIVILPLTMVGASLAKEAAVVFAKMKSGEFNLVTFMQQIFDAAPGWLKGLLDRFGIGDLSGLQEKLSSGLMQGGQMIASQALNIGQSTFDFIIQLGIMLYLLFFLFKDGDTLAARFKDAIPLRPSLRDDLIEKFIVVIRATVKGGILVALAQGALGGLIFWILGISAALLWAVLMAFLSLLPAVGAGLVWMPVAIYLLATGSVVKGIVLIAYGFLVIGLVDNILRPMLVGKDTKLPDYLILLATIGGINALGLNGFVVGPVIAAMFVAGWAIFAKSRKGGDVETEKAV